MRVQADKIADGVWYLTGGTHHSVAVEFKNYVALVECPLNDERALAVIDSCLRAVDELRRGHAFDVRPRLLEDRPLWGRAGQRHRSPDVVGQDVIGVAILARYRRTVGQRDAHRGRRLTGNGLVDELRTAGQQRAPLPRVLGTRHLAVDSVDDRPHAVAEDPFRRQLHLVAALAEHRLDRESPHLADLHGAKLVSRLAAVLDPPYPVGPHPCGR